MRALAGPPLQHPTVLERTLDATGGNQSEAARRLRVSGMTLLDKLKKHGLR